MSKDELEKGYDLDGDGSITQSEIDRVKAMKEFENQDQRADSQRKMAWFSLFGMLLYPALIVICSVLGLATAITALAGMAPTYFGSVALIVAAFYGSEAYKANKS